jgi:hypothetical protein
MLVDRIAGVYLEFELSTETNFNAAIERGGAREVNLAVSTDTVIAAAVGVVC